MFAFIIMMRLMFYDEEEEDVSFIMLTRSGFYSYYSGEDLELFALRSGGK